MEFIRGSTWSFSGVLPDAAGNPIDLTGATITSQVRAQDGTLIDSMIGTVVNGPAGVLRIYKPAAATASWPIGTAETDVKIQLATGDVIQTGKVAFDIVRGVSE